MIIEKESQVEGTRVRDRVREKEKERWCERVRDRER